jgi:hypothetical protein
MHVIACRTCGRGSLSKGGEGRPGEARVTPSSKAKPNAHSMCAQESSLYTYRTENEYRITNVII